MERFPGRTLEELDQMDVNRYLRAMEARSTIELERKRGAWLAGVLNSADISKSEWAVIEMHDSLVSDDGA